MAAFDDGWLRTDADVRGLTFRLSFRLANERYVTATMGAVWASLIGDMPIRSLQKRVARLAADFAARQGQPASVSVALALALSRERLCELKANLTANGTCAHSREFFTQEELGALQQQLTRV